MLKEFTQWLLDLVKEIFTSLWSFVIDVFAAILDLVLSGIVALLSAVPVPEELQGGLQTFWGQLDGSILYFVNAFGLPEALAMIGTAFLFRLGRKVATLFQW